MSKASKTFGDKIAGWMTTWKTGWRNPETGLLRNIENNMGTTVWQFHNVGADRARDRGPVDQWVDPEKFVDVDGDDNPFDTRLGTRQDYQPRAKVKKRDPHEDREWYPDDKPPVIKIAIPPHIAKYPWWQQQWVLHKRWLGCGLPPKPGNDIVLHNIRTIRGDPEKRWPVDVVELKTSVVRDNFDRYTPQFAMAQNRERQRAHLKTAAADKIPVDPRDDVPQEMKVPWPDKDEDPWKEKWKNGGK